MGSFFFARTSRSFVFLGRLKAIIRVSGMASFNLLEV